MVENKNLTQDQAQDNEILVEIKNLTKSYGNSTVHAVHDLSISVRPGEIYGFLGSNGAGKSTTIKCLVGIYPFQHGDILINGVSIKTNPLEAKKQIGYVSDNHAVFERLTGREYVNHIANLYRVDMASVEECCNRLLKIFKLEEAFDRPIKSSSHGMKQKITIMSALVHNPKLWILDEPLTGLDPESIYQVKECMKEHAAKGNIVFFSSHIIDVVENICHKIAIIRKGQILACKTVAEIRDSGVALEDYYMNMIDGNTQSPVTVKEAEEMEKLAKGE